MGSCSIPWAVDNSDSSSIVEQSQQGTDSSCIPLLFLVSGSVEYPMPYASCLASCSVGWRLSCSLAGPYEFCLSCHSLLNAAQLVWGFGLLQPLLFRVFCIAPWDSLSGLCALWGNLYSFPSLLLGRCTLGWPVCPVIGFPLLGVHPSISIVKLIMIGYHCNHLDGQINYQASAHWLIGLTIMYQLCNQWLCHSTLITLYTTSVDPPVTWNLYQKPEF